MAGKVSRRKSCRSPTIHNILILKEEQHFFLFFLSYSLGRSNNSAYICGAKSFSKERMMLDYLALYESIKIISRPRTGNLSLVHLRVEYAQ
jgi:hypothetical protein